MVDTYKEFGVDLSLYKSIKDRADALAMDADLITTPNNGVPAELLAYFDNAAIDILTAKRQATAVFDEVKKGDRTTPYYKFHTRENVGFTQPYSDYSDNGKSGTNYDWMARENYLFETTINYGDLESEIHSKARINYAGDQQKAAATNIAIDTNRFYLFGVAGANNYGLINQPNLPAAITAAASVADPSSTSWDDKEGQEIYNDIVAMVTDMSERGEGWIDTTTKFKLVIGPGANACLLKQNNLGTASAMDLIKRNLPNLEVVVVPEYENNGVRNCQLIAVDVDGQRTGDMAFSEKFRAGRIVEGLSNYRQKFMAGVYGCVIYRPLFVTTMTGI